MEEHRRRQGAVTLSNSFDGPAQKRKKTVARGRDYCLALLRKHHPCPPSEITNISSNEILVVTFDQTFGNKDIEWKK